MLKCLLPNALFSRMISDLHARGEDQMTPLHLVAKYKPKKEKIYGSGDGVSNDKETLLQDLNGLS